MLSESWWLFLRLTIIKYMNFNLHINVTTPSSVFPLFSWDMSYIFHIAYLVAFNYDGYRKFVRKESYGNLNIFKGKKNRTKKDQNTGEKSINCKG